VIVVISATITGDEAIHSDIYTDPNLFSWVFFRSWRINLGKLGQILKKI